jgi:DNA-binding MarR family transcriptional regulator
VNKSPFDVTHQNKSTEGRIVAALERISQAFRVLLWSEGKEFSLSPIQIQILIFLLHHSGEKRKVSYVADEFNMTKATISDVVKSLEEKGLIKKTYEKHDARSYIIHLTKKGNDVAEKTSLFPKELQKPIDKLHADDKENMLLSLMEIIRHLNKSGIITIQRMCVTCSHYQPGNKKQEHFCRLLNMKLEATELRIDCPEHESI